MWALEKARPESFCFGRANVQANDLALAVSVRGHSDYCRNRDNAPAFALLEIGRIQPEIGPIPHQRAIQEGADAIVDVLAQLAHRALADACQPHRLHQLINAPGRDTADPGFLDDRNQRVLRSLPVIKERWKIAALP